MEIAAHLCEFEFLKHFRQEDLQLIGSLIEELTYQDGDVIIDDKKPSTSIYFVLKGKVKIFKVVATTVNILSLLEPGDVFGEVAFVDRKARSASVSAIGEVVLGRFGHDHFEVIKKQNPAFGMDFLVALMHELTRKFRAVNEGLDIKSPEYTINEVINSGQLVKITTSAGTEYYCTIKSSDRSQNFPFLKLDVKGQIILLPFHELRTIVFPNRYGKF